MHGGDIYRNKVHMDFSVNVNPLGVPVAVEKALVEGIALAATYPDPESRDLRRAIANHFSLEPDQVLCGNGASELLMAICQSLKPDKVLLPSPGFTGYAHAIHASNGVIQYELLKEENGFAIEDSFCQRIEEDEVDMVFLTNPNNPTGKLLNLEQVVAIAEACAKAKAYLVIDECFIELTEYPEYSFVKELDHHSNVLVLRAFTKSFALPGVRLGYLLGEASLLAQIKDHLPEWSVSVLAQKAGLAAMGQEQHLAKARTTIWVERDYLKRALEELGYKVYDSASCYLLFQGQAGLQEDLLKQGILIRDCSDYVGIGKGYYRIAVKGHVENVALIKAMEGLK